LLCFKADPASDGRDDRPGPDAYALSVNIAHRHLTKGQQAMVAARACPVSGQTQRAVVARRACSVSEQARARLVSNQSHRAMIAARACFVSKQTKRAMAEQTGLNTGRIGQAATVVTHAGDLGLLGNRASPSMVSF
jgi:hypothetical protein